MRVSPRITKSIESWQVKLRPETEFRLFWAFGAKWRKVPLEQAFEYVNEMLAIIHVTAKEGLTSTSLMPTPERRDATTKRKLKRVRGSDG